MAEQISIDDYKTIQGAMDAAEQSERPFMIPTEGDEIVVAGDVNDTALNKRTFSVVFRVPKVKEDGEIETVYRKVDYKDVFITPRQDLKIVQAVGDLLPFVKKVQEDGGIGNYTDEEIIALINSLSDEMVDRIYNLVASVLGVEDKLKEYMEFGSVLTVLGEFFQGFPGGGERG